MKSALFFLIATYLFFPIFPHETFAATIIDINHATIKELSKLPSIGEQRAKKIVRSRKKVGPFKTPHELVTRKIISETTFRTLRKRIVAGSSSTGKKKSHFPRMHTPLQGKITLLENSQFLFTLIRRIEKAKHTIHLVTFLFKTTKSKSNKANKIVEKLIEAGKRGVKIDIILEKSGFNASINAENLQTRRKLRHKNIQVRFDSKKVQTHTKLAVFDDTWTLLGSHNISHSALFRNNELSIMVQSKPFAKQALHYIHQIK